MPPELELDPTAPELLELELLPPPELLELELFPPPELLELDPPPPELELLEFDPELELELFDPDEDELPPLPASSNPGFELLEHAPAATVHAVAPASRHKVTLENFADIADSSDSGE